MPAIGDVNLEEEPVTPKREPAARGFEGNRSMRAWVGAAEVLVFVLLAYGSYPASAAPPPNYVGGVPATVAVPVGASAALAAFLIAKFWRGAGSSQNSARCWRIAATVLAVGHIGSAVLYAYQFSARTVTYASEMEVRHTLIVGTEYSAAGDSIRKRFNSAKGRAPLVNELLAATGTSNPSQLSTVWADASVVRSSDILVLLYTAMLVLFACTCATLIESYASELSRRKHSEGSA